MIMNAAEVAPPALRALAREILEAQAQHLGVSLDVGDVLARRAEGAPAPHITAAADKLLEQLAALEGTTPPGRGILAVLARVGAQLLMTATELEEDGLVACGTRAGAGCGPTQTGGPEGDDTSTRAPSAARPTFAATILPAARPRILLTVRQLSVRMRSRSRKRRR
jgi:hypothetical protein